MYYNEFNNLKLSALGFGCMRFKLNEDGTVNQQIVDEMIDYAMKNGVNYYDTAYPYLSGQSETALAKALSRYPRDSYYLADKFPGHSLPGPVDNVALFNVSLKRCQTDYFDFYLLHNITEWSVKIYEDENYHIMEDIFKLKEEGKIKHLGFSFHGGPELLEELLTKYEGKFEFVQIQCNYLDWSLQNAKKKYDIITSHGLGVWVMEPLRGGKLAKLNEANQAKLNGSAADYGFRFLQSLPNIKMVLSGMNELVQVEENIRTFEERRVLSEEELNVMFDIAETMKSSVPCTGCRYCCDGCPMGLNIPYLIEIYNDFKVNLNSITATRIDGLDEDKKPYNCIGCGQCSHACPQGIHVADVIAELNQLYDASPKWAQEVKSRHESIRKDLDMK